MEELIHLFISGNVKDALEYMKQFSELKDFRKSLSDIFVHSNFINYKVPEKLNKILLQYQIYFRDVFYLRIEPEKAENSLKRRLSEILDCSFSELETSLIKVFNDNGYQIKSGITNGFYGPYVWKETEIKEFKVEIPSGIKTLKINVIHNCIFRSWMDFITLGEKGTGGWTDEDGTIYCIAKAYDFNDESFTVSFLKHEVQHSEDFILFPGIQPHELEYRAKLTELIYSNKQNLLEKFCNEEAVECSEYNSHAIASMRIKSEMSGFLHANKDDISAKASELFKISCSEMKAKYST